MSILPELPHSCKEKSISASRLHTGDFTVITGMSGIKLAYKVLELSGVQQERVKPNHAANRSEEFWTGWALAYYQWKTAISFAEIIHDIPIKEIMALYSPYHEMDIRQFADKMDALCQTAKTKTSP